MSEHDRAISLISDGYYSEALALLEDSTDPSDALLRIRCRIGDLGYVRLVDKTDILDDISKSGDTRSIQEILSEFASGDPDVFADPAVEKEVGRIRRNALIDIEILIETVAARETLGAPSLKILGDSVVSVYRNHPLYPDLLVSADMWDELSFHRYLHTLDTTVMVNGNPYTPERLYTALCGLKDKLIRVEKMGFDLSSLCVDDITRIREYGTTIADRDFPLRGLGKITNRSSHDSVVSEYTELAEEIGRMIHEAERIRERIRHGIIVDAWDFRDR